MGDKGAFSMALHALGSTGGGERGRRHHEDSHVLLDELVDEDCAAWTVECAYDFLQEQLCRLDPSSSSCSMTGGCRRHDEEAALVVRVGGLALDVHVGMRASQVNDCSLHSAL